MSRMPCRGITRLRNCEDASNVARGRRENRPLAIAPPKDLLEVQNAIKVYEDIDLSNPLSVSLATMSV